MNKNALLLAAGLAVLAGPAFATHPNEACTVRIDVAALAKTAGSDPSSVRVRFVFGGGISNLTDMTAPPAEVVSKPAQGAWVYATEIHSNLYYRTLRAVKVESLLYKTTDGTPEWSVSVERGEDAKAGKDSPIRCVQYAD